MMSGCRFGAIPELLVQTQSITHALMHAQQAAQANFLTVYGQGFTDTLLCMEDAHLAGKLLAANVVLIHQPRSSLQCLHPQLVICRPNQL